MPSREQRLHEHVFRLRRRLLPRCKLHRPLFDVVSWVNVALLVLMFFIAQSGFVLQPGIAVNLPASPMADGANYGSLVVTITQEGLLFFDDARTSLDAFAEAVRRQAQRDPDATLVIEADARVRHGDLVRIYNIATAAGLQRVVLATRVLPPPPVQ